MALYRAAVLARTYVKVPDPIGTVILDFTRTTTTWASDGWHNDELNRLVAEYVGNFDRARQSEPSHRIAAIIQNELPVVTVSWHDHTVAISSRVSRCKSIPSRSCSDLSGEGDASGEQIEVSGLER
jgi:peptide/nickel transport system substrate-binding protein